jgi:hypothetical protein
MEASKREYLITSKTESDLVHKKIIWDILPHRGVEKIEDAYGLCIDQH